ncbi:methyltransferase domain-containing protein [Heliobacterium undosum]|uniref:Methyltransferase domain-containing protein n=1 Tax=Heliomicrobium undosum TaxID=121734 RepID=A0A845L464_9FIRM|nr:class I SAM-dependent methyltransferase [Heliomicrobium undosum]MZP29624.1 methyltransferase domain-containing protein [Heliomicrobium undosum]
MNLYEALFPYYDTVFPVKAPVVNFLAEQFAGHSGGDGTGERVAGEQVDGKGVTGEGGYGIGHSDGGASGLRLLDAACGTGGHALALAKRGYSLLGIDLQEEMIDLAQKKAQGLSTPPQFAVMDMGAVDPELWGRWDGVYCIGNSLPHLGDMDAIRKTLAGWSRGMRAGGARPGGTILIQVVNFANVLAKGGQLPTLEGTQAGRHVRFERRYEPADDGRIRFLTRLTVSEPSGDEKSTAGGEWTAETLLLPLSPSDLQGVLNELGYDKLRWFGDLTGKELTEASPAVVVAARKA